MAPASCLSFDHWCAHAALDFGSDSIPAIHHEPRHLVLARGGCARGDNVRGGSRGLARVMKAPQLNWLWRNHDKSKAFSTPDYKWDFHNWLIQLVIGKKKSVIANVSIRTEVDSSADGPYLFTIPDGVEGDFFVWRANLSTQDQYTIVLRPFDASVGPKYRCSREQP